jgi:ATP-binding cassette subfamily F protein 3
VPSASPEGYHEVIAHVNLTIRRGEKVAFVGRNGEGKSTLVKCILGEIPFEGSLRVGHNAQIGYFAQNQAQLLDPELTVFDTIDRVARGDVRMRIRDILGAFMFGGEASDKKVKVLSGGERSRLAMIKLLLEPVNFLILDEPTNHLDLRSKDVLKEAIAAFDGTVIVVSHDREFLDGLVSKVYAFGGGRVREHLGGIYDWIKSQQEENSSLALLKREGANTPAKRKLSDSGTVTAPSPSEKTGGESKSAPLSYEAQKALARQRKKLERTIADAEAEIAELEAAIRLLEDQMSTPEGAADTTLYERHSRLKDKLEATEATWLEASEALTSL